MIELFICALLGILFLAVLDLSITVKLIILIGVGILLLTTYTLYNRKVTKMKETIEFLSYQIIEINDQLYRYDGECPMQKAEIKNIDDSEDDGSEE